MNLARREFLGVVAAAFAPNLLHPFQQPVDKGRPHYLLMRLRRRFRR